MNQNERLEGFMREINKNAEAQVKKIEAKTERATKEQLERFAAAAKSEFDAKAAYELERVRTETNREIAHLHSEVRRAAVAHREALLQKVFDEAASQLRAFCETPAYPQKLRACIAALAARLGGGCTVFVCARDLELAKDICKDIPAVKAVCVRDEIKIGLACACNAQETLFLEDTYDSRLLSQRDSFLRESGMILDA